jgi:uncharacterized protein YsxB (DUF464 family)
MYCKNILKVVSGFINKTDKYAIDDNILNKALLVNPSNEEESKNSKTGTKVIFPVNRNGIIYGFMVYGYTGYAIKGYDIVSSAITVLCYHTINTIRANTNDISEYKEGNAIMLFSLPNLKNGIGCDLSKIFLKSMVTSMFDIQEQYNDFIKVFIKWDT